ncbi:MAG: M24 family metallopeptidase [Gemmataceae bacterium]|nr:M24 family metallopeptidase [Gemmataceae bacterium]
MDPFESGPLRIDPDDDNDVAVGLPPEFAAQPDEEPPPAGLAARRADVDAKQEQVGRVLEAMGCEAAVLLAPVHVSWFTAGLNVRGLLAEAERPGVFTNGRQRWLLCSNVDTQRLFDEELDGLGFQLKEWAWDAGRADLLLNVTTGRKVASDRPFPNIPQLTDRLRPLIRVLSEFDLAAYRELGKVVAHAVEATARNLSRGQTEEEIAGQLGHRLLHRGAEPHALSVTADDRGTKYRRAGFTAARVAATCTLQATAHRGGLYVTCARTVSFGRPPDEFHAAFDHALRLAAAFRSVSRPDEGVGAAKAAAQTLLANSRFEFEWRHSQPGYGAGRFPAEELRRAGHDERFVLGQPVVWQPRVGPAALADTVLIGADGADPVTPPEGWPFKRVTIRGRAHDVPDMLVRTT